MDVTRFKEIRKLKLGNGLGHRGRKGRKLGFVKLSMAGDIQSRGSGVETMKPFIREIVT